MEETGDTLVDNARLKARARWQPPGCRPWPTTPDSRWRLWVGRPGSTRPGSPGPCHVRRQRGQAAGGTGPGGRPHAGTASAVFRTVALVAYPDGDDVWASGEVTGIITSEAVGRSGFGYDPVFAPDDGDGDTFAQMSSEEKHRISHRGRAFRALSALLAGTGRSA